MTLVLSPLATFRRLPARLINEAYFRRLAKRQRGPGKMSPSNARFLRKSPWYVENK